MQKISPENSLSLPKNHKKIEMTSFSYDVNDHVYPNQNLFNFVVSQKSKPIPYESVLLNVKISITLILDPYEVRWILTLCEHGHWRRVKSFRFLTISWLPKEIFRRNFFCIVFRKIYCIFYNIISINHSPPLKTLKNIKKLKNSEQWTVNNQPLNALYKHKPQN